jgi:hypothetical protein
MPINCDQFVEVKLEGGKRKCAKYIAGGNCSIIENRFCKIKPPKEPRDIKQLSHSTVSYFRDCRRYTWLDKIKMIRPKVRLQYFIVGGVLHVMTGDIYINKFDHTYDSVLKMFNKEKADQPKVETVKAIAIMTSYIKYAGHNTLLQFQNVVPEVEYVSTFNGYKIVVKYDLLEKNDVFFVENKFVGGTRTLDKVTKFENSDQLTLYFFMKPKLQKCVLNLVKKVTFQFNPMKESLQDFMNRSKKDIDSHPGKYFRPVIYERDEFDYESFEREFSVASTELMTIPREAKYFYKNIQSCSIMDCQFQSICETGVVDPEKYYVYVSKPKTT